MKRLSIVALLITALCLSLVMVITAQSDDTDTDTTAETDQPTQETIDPDRIQYIGSRDCRDCHRGIAGVHGDSAHALTMVEVDADLDPADDDYPIVADFAQESDVLSFTLDEVAYTLGAGRHMQAFISGNRDDGYTVLPAMWDVAAQAWVELALDDNAYGPNCAGCHTTGLDVDDYTWQEEAVMCETCHGPGEMHVDFADDAGGGIDDDERADIYGSISLALDGAACGQCHARGTSTGDDPHPFPTGYYAGVNDLANHFELVETGSEPYWLPSGHGATKYMQYNESRISGHPDSLANIRESQNFDASCISCHSAAQFVIDLRLSNDDIDPDTIDPLALVDEYDYGITCAVCHDSHMIISDDDPQADYFASLPANLRADDYTQCVTCHSDGDISDGVHEPVQQMYEGVALIEEVEAIAGVHYVAYTNDEGGPTCATCHMTDVPTDFGPRSTHTMAIIPPGAALDVDMLLDSCSGCHTEGPDALQQLIDDIQADTERRIEAARAALTDETAAWVGQTLDILEADGSGGLHNYAYSDEMLDAVEVELGLVAAPAR